MFANPKHKPLSTISKLARVFHLDYLELKNNILEWGWETKCTAVIKDMRNQSNNTKGKTREI